MNVRFVSVVIAGLCAAVAGCTKSVEVREGPVAVRVACVQATKPFTRADVAQVFAGVAMFKTCEGAALNITITDTEGGGRVEKVYEAHARITSFEVQNVGVTTTVVACVAGGSCGSSNPYELFWPGGENLGIDLVVTLPSTLRDVANAASNASGVR